MICAVVLAAGRSRRMGTQKLLLPVAGMPLVARVVAVLAAQPVDRIFLVTGRDGEAVAAAVAPMPVTRVPNGDPDSDMLGSVRCGLRALPSETRTVLVMPGDMPGIHSGTIAALLEARDRTGASLLLPTYQGRRGHPLVLDGARYRDEILTEHDGVGLRGLLLRHASEVHGVELDDPGILLDLDRPEDYALYVGVVN